ncbi:unnamed protein product, partial [Ectocarpus fasciculatus]
MGYRSDLTAGMGYGDEVYNLAPAAAAAAAAAAATANDAQRRPLLPELTTKALTCTEFYLAASHLSSGVSMGAESETMILCKVAMDSPRESMQLLLTCLSDIYHLRPAWPVDDRRDKVLHTLVMTLLRVRDEVQGKRISMCFEDPHVGLIPVIKAQMVE